MYFVYIRTKYDNLYYFPLEINTVLCVVHLPTFRFIVYTLFNVYMVRTVDPENILAYIFTPRKKKHILNATIFLVRALSVINRNDFLKLIYRTKA